MVSMRTKTGMLQRLKKGGTLTADIYVKFPNRRLELFARRKKVFLESNRKGVIISDNRPVIRKGGRWIYLIK